MVLVACDESLPVGGLTMAVGGIASLSDNGFFSEQQTAVTLVAARQQRRLRTAATVWESGHQPVYAVTRTTVSPIEESAAETPQKPSA
ncbi:hypothetical protein MRX96_013512 [Rhipicephalus microplus]